MKDILKWVVFGGLFAVPFLTLYVENNYFFPFITGKNFWFRIIVDLTLVAYIALAMYEPKYRPQWSWILGGAAALLGVMFFANLFGEHPRSSFWSNFERMDGYVSLVHTYLYALMLGSVLKTKIEWNWLLNTSLVVSVLVAVGGLAQYFDISSIISMYNIGANSGRLDSTLGNAAYMAIYMLFHIFILFWLFIGTKSAELRWLYGLFLVPMFSFVLIETGTRGTAVGLAAGIMVMSAYIGLFANQFREFRKFAIGGFLIICIAIGGFIAFKDSSFIQEQPNLARIANISSDDLRIRGIIWGMAWEGVQERPILGWGQSNFNYVFNDKYDPRLYGQEQWFDRAHNIFMDWLITGGFLGLLAYLSIFIACAYYLIVRPLRTDDQSFTVLERGVLLGLLAGYFTHNLVVFDNIVSYIFFAVILGLIHARVSTPFKALKDKKVDEALITQAYLPVGIATFAALVYFVHAPGMAAAGDIIKAFRTLQPSVEQGVQRPPEGPEVMLERFSDALDRNSFAHQEITEQISQQAMGLARSPQVPEDVRALFASTSEAQLERLVAEKPNDARIHVFIASYYRAVGQVDRAAQEMARARELSPEKQAIINQQGFIEMSRGQYGAALDFFETSFRLDEENLEAREYYAAALLYTGGIDQATALMDSAAAKKRFAQSDFLLGAARQVGARQLMFELFRERVEIDPNRSQNWASLSFLHFEEGENDLAIQTLREGAALIPEFETAANCIADNIAAGVAEPQVGC